MNGCELAADLQLPDLQLKEALEAVVGARGPSLLAGWSRAHGAVQGSGKGGRNQELACVLEWSCDSGHWGLLTCCF